MSTTSRSSTITAITGFNSAPPSVQHDEECFMGDVETDRALPFPQEPRETDGKESSCPACFKFQVDVSPSCKKASPSLNKNNSIPDHLCKWTTVLCTV